MTDVSWQLTHREWVIRSSPEKRGFHYHARVEVERRPQNYVDNREVFRFTDIGYFDTQASANERGVAWAKAWLDVNF
ncbi:hypothetical protein [Paraburkholderia youngii]|uniref:hypothetical protein n=1 Tax=Paraburkholderia youngii TaxID=2782701 RepID=UPI003D249DE9